MTRKDFILIADALAKAWRATDAHVDRLTVDYVIYTMAGELGSAFPRFDRTTFINYIDEKKCT